MDRTGLLMFAHGARDARWAAPFDEVVARVRAARPAQPTDRTDLATLNLGH